MKTKIRIIAMVVAILTCITSFAQVAYANGGRGRGHGGSHGYSKHYKYHRYYPQSFFYYRKLFYYPKRSYYYYYDVYPEKSYYFYKEKDVYSSNPDYLAITSIANMASQGVPDVVIISEIERTRSTYKLSSETITYLKQNNVSDRVIDVMLEAGRKR